ncbi:hypothetical protein [Massilia sp. CF038]|uniref:hypothetical protein n=1 Tax=Massilia sp. CF038 TaxID=1881045 RepID=UPI000915E165|nr:hypothetical protein [Massilia sp. CF038]SHH08582.1 hypothetical protein SAMN05428948_2697 [Massilia sp. CF038]
MSDEQLAYRATTEEACAWLAERTGSPWSLARMIEAGITPYVWLDYDASRPEMFGDANGGYAAPIFFEGDTTRLAQGSADVLITMTKDVHQLVVKLEAPGLRRALHELRFLRKDVEKLARPVVAAKPVPAAESKVGINADQVLAAFGAMVRIDLAAALAAGEGIFGDEGARIKGSARKGKSKTMWHPVTLALGLNDMYRVPLPRLSKAFQSHDVLYDWARDWELSLSLLRN